MKKLQLVCMTALLSLVIMAPRVTVAAESIKFGVPLTLTGIAAQVGIDNRNGIILAAKHKGTIMGRPIELVIEDTEGKSETGIRKAEKLVFKDKVVALLGVAYTNVGLAIASEMDRLNVPFITTNVMSPKFYGLHPLVFRCGQMGDDQSARAHALGIRKIPDLADRSYYVLADDFAYGQSCAEEFIKQAGKMHIKIQNPSYDKAALNLTDWSPFVSKIAASDAGAVYCCIRSAVVPRFIEQAHSFGLTKKVRLVGSSPSEDALEAGGKTMMGYYAICSWSWDLDTPKSHAFAKAYWEEFKLVPSSQAAQAYTGASLVFDTIEKAGSTEPMKIAAALKGASYEGPYGKVHISPKDNCIRTPALLVETQPAPPNPYGAKVVKKIIAHMTAEEVGPAE